MPTTVFFATNRALTGPAESVSSYSNGIVPPSDPMAMTYGTAFVENANLTADTVGAINSIQNIARGGFSKDAMGDLSAPGRNVLVFVHGFDNSFEDAITRAAFNQQWFAGAGLDAASTTVIAFSWPSLGQLLSFPVPWEDYLHDQTMAGQSGAHLSSFFHGLRTILTKARAGGSRTILLAHSMGNWALQAGIESWFSHGFAPALLFDEAVLAAADERYDTFGFPLYGRLCGLRFLANRISIYFSRDDQVLHLSNMVNLGAQRLGQDGPRNASDLGQFSPDQYRMVDCTAFRDYDADFASSHQYYRRSPGVREDIAAVMGGK